MSHPTWLHKVPPLSKFPVHLFGWPESGKHGLYNLPACPSQFWLWNATSPLLCIYLLSSCTWRQASLWSLLLSLLPLHPSLGSLSAARPRRSWGGSSWLVLDDHHLDGIFFLSLGRMPYQHVSWRKSKPNHHRPPHLHRGSALLLSLPTSTILASCPRTELDLIQEKMSDVMLLPLRENSAPNHRVVVLFPGVHQDKLNKNTAVQPQYIQVNQSKERARVCL